MTVLSNKIAIVTGASSGIGHATAKLFAREGARVIVNGRRRAELDALVAQIDAAGGQAHAVAGDVRDDTVAKNLVEVAVDRFGGLDIAFNNAGTVGEMGSVAELSLSGWHDTLDTNLTSAFPGARYQVPAMIERGGGALIFTSSFVGYSAGMAGMAAYGASKAALIGMTQCLAVELGVKGIRVNVILPGDRYADEPGKRTRSRSGSTNIHQRPSCPQAHGIAG